MARTATTAKIAENIGHDTRQHIVETAMGLFLANGFGDTTMDEIARTARISKHTLYGHFRDKADLFEAVVVQDMERFQNLPDLTLDKRKPDEVLFEAARWIYDHHVSTASMAMHRVLIGAATDFGELITRHYAFRFQASVSWIVAYIASLTGDGALNIPNPKRAAVRFVLMASEGSRTVMGYKPAGLKDRERFARLTVALFMHGQAG